MFGTPDDAFGSPGAVGPVFGPLADFLKNGLVDPRVAAAEFPFDRPTLTAAGALPVPEPAPGVSAAAALLTLLALKRPRSRANATACSA